MNHSGFQHTAARRRLVPISGLLTISWMFQHTAARRRLAFPILSPAYWDVVSTHSRPKAAGTQYRAEPPSVEFQHTAARRRLAKKQPCPLNLVRFQHTAARRRLGGGIVGSVWSSMFQHTAARRRLADFRVKIFVFMLFQHTAARRRLGCGACECNQRHEVSTHSRPKAAGMVVQR